MILAVILLSLVCIFSLTNLWAQRDTCGSDADKVISNRGELMKLAYEDLQQGKIDKALYLEMRFLFHPDFKNSWSYVPPESWEYTRQMYKLDSDFWSYYKITPDYVIPSKVVYDLYRDFMITHLHR